MEQNSKLAYATLLTKNEYLPGVLVLNNSLQSVKSRYPLVVMATPNLPQEARNILRLEGIPIREVEYLQPKDVELAELDKRFADTWTKLHVWELAEYDRLVLLDSDMVVKRNMDELLDTLELSKGHIAGAHACACNPRKFPHYPKDWIPENCAHTAVLTPTSPPPQPSHSTPRPYGLLNSGLVVLRPSLEAFQSILDTLNNDPIVKTFLFPDQDFIAHVFKGKWTALPWFYNALRTLRNIHSQLWSDEEVRCVHYILSDKPWQSRAMIHDKSFAIVNGWWWAELDEVMEKLRKKDELAANFVAKYVDFDTEWRP
ncbi:glycosyl transferase [Coprinopsis marcescibilis]|uniref:Glycosyl transferase n=1 Tax=Coprinopsis marcescibilis TaxID=230819 RepID=A0A5C3LCS4_COPMA|nr:glycosyl transferase [Coprinopsis marcescibilis]